MKAERFRVANYKSFGDAKNELDISNSITVIIGKNESGKTNLTEAASEIDFSRRPYILEQPEKKLNRISGASELYITLTLSCSSFEGETEITVRPNYIKNNKKERRFENSYNIYISGALIDILSSDAEITASLNSLRKADDKYTGTVNEYKTSFCTNPYQLLDKLQAMAKAEKKPQLREQLLFLYTKTAHYVWELPYIMVINNNGKNSLKEYYFLSDLPYLGKDDIFYKLLDAAGISAAQVVDTLTSQKPIAREILKNGLKSISERFADFTKKSFELSYEIRDGRFYLTVLTNSKRLMYDELPISEKWFFSLFIDMLSRRILNRNILFVLDQPGLYMHVNAQKELMKIFKNIALSGHQIIYTTHSPFLIDINEIANIRAVEKQNGQTHIYNKIYAGEITKGAKIETLSPIFEALGTDFSRRHTLDEGRLNLIVEGISDYYYIKAMLQYLCNDKENTPYVLPSVGASNIGNVASILIGWGQPFKAIFDYDEEGKKAVEKIQHKLGLVAGEDIFYINGKKKYRADGICRVEDMLDKSDRTKIHTAAGKHTKALVSREFYDLILEGTLIPSPVTINNFKKLFTALGILS